MVLFNCQLLPQYIRSGLRRRIASLARLSVCLSVCLSAQCGILTRKQKKGQKKTKIGVKVPKGRCNRCANVQFKGLKRFKSLRSFKRTAAYNIYT